MPFSVSPSVTVTERDLSAIIPATSTSTAAFVGRFNWGPVDKVVTITSEAELYSTFGAPDPGERGIDWFVVSNYLNYGDRVHVVRVDEGNSVVGGGLTASNVFSGSTGAYVRLKDAGTRGNFLKFAALTSPLGATMHGINHKYTGVSITDELGIQVFSYAPTSTDAVYDAVQNGILSTSGVTLDECHIAVIDVNGIHGASGAVLEKFEGLSRWKGVADRSGSSLYYKDVVNANSNYIEIEPDTRNTIWRGDGFTAGATGDPTWSPTSSIIYEHTLPNGSITDSDGHPQIAIAGHDGGVGASLEANGIAGTTWCFTNSYFNKFKDGADSGVTYPYDGVGTDSGFEVAGNVLKSAIINGYHKHFRDNDFIDFDFILGGAAEKTIAQQLIDICEKRKDCMVFLSPPSSPAGSEYTDVGYSTDLAGFSGPANLVSYRTSNNFNSSYAVMDSGWKLMYDSYNDRNRFVPLNADIAGLVASLDGTASPHASPAGFNRGRIRNVVKLALNPTKAQRDELYSVGLNPVVTFPGEGTVLFGDKTLQRRATALDKINVRRLLITLEKAISTAAKFKLFEFNDAFTRQSFVSTIEPFLRRVQAQGGVQDYRIVCDETNNPADVVDTNKFVADIFIKPSRSINFIQLNFTTLRSDAIFDEAVV